MTPAHQLSPGAVRAAMPPVLRALHRSSAMLIAAFALVHIANHALRPVDMPAKYKATYAG